MRMNEKRRDACVSLLCGGVGGRARQSIPRAHASFPSGKM